MCSGSDCSGRPGAEPCSLPGREEKEGGQVSSIPGSLPSREKERRGDALAAQTCRAHRDSYSGKSQAIVTILPHDRPQLVFQM